MHTLLGCPTLLALWIEKTWLFAHGSRLLAHISRLLHHGKGCCNNLGSFIAHLSMLSTIGGFYWLIGRSTLGFGAFFGIFVLFLDG
jgi:hypothetical protein